MEHLRNGHNYTIFFVDADAFVASIKTDDPNHKRAQRLFDMLKERPVQFLTSNYVFAEVITVLSQRVGKTVALSYIAAMTAPDSVFQINRANEVIEEEAIEIFKKQTSKNTSFVDCTNMACMQQLHADAIFSFDEVYKKNGFQTVADLLPAETAKPS